MQSKPFLNRAVHLHFPDRNIVGLQKKVVVERVPSKNHDLEHDSDDDSMSVPSMSSNSSASSTSEVAAAIHNTTDDENVRNDGQDKNQKEAVHNPNGYMWSDSEDDNDADNNDDDDDDSIDSQHHNKKKYDYSQTKRNDFDEFASSFQEN